MPVIKSIDKLNKRNKAISISTFDFSTLYTKIPHDKLSHVLKELIDFALKGAKNVLYLLISMVLNGWMNSMVINLCLIKHHLKRL